MGFTIGGIREIRSGARRRGRSPECTAIAELTGLWGWDVVPGAHTVSGACSCGHPCRTPGAHPLDFAPHLPAGATLDEATTVWSDVPDATVMLPVGHTFDVIEVAEAAGRRALSRLERMGLPLGPVTATPDGRAHFFVAPGAAALAPRPPVPHGLGRPDGAGPEGPGQGRVHHGPTVGQGRPGPGDLATPPGPGLGDEAPGGETAAGDTGVRGAQVKGIKSARFSARSGHLMVF